MEVEMWTSCLAPDTPEELLASKNPFVEAMADLLEGLLPGKKREAVEKERSAKKRKPFFLRGGRS